MSTVVNNPTKVITGKKCVMSYLNVNEPKTPLGGGTPKYSVSIIIPKSDTVTIEKIKAAIKAAYEEGQSKLKGNSKVVPALEDLKTPLRDGDKDRKGDEAYKNSVLDSLREAIGRFLPAKETGAAVSADGGRRCA